MLTQRLFLFLGLLLGIIPSACQAQNTADGTGQGSTQNFSLTPFTRADLSGALQITLTQGSPQLVRLEGPADKISELEVAVQGDELVVKPKKSLAWNMHGARGQVKLYLTVPSLTALQLSGASTLQTTTPITGTSFDMDVSGASTLNMALAVQDLKMECSGASRLNLNGTAAHQKLDISGASKLDATQLSTKTAVVDASGASKVQLNVSDSLEADVSGASNLTYSGSPRTQLETSGAASIHHQ